MIVALVLAALVAIVVLWSLGNDDTRPAPDPTAPAPRVGLLVDSER
jgi:hypothetical protein